MKTLLCIKVLTLLANLTFGQTLCSFKTENGTSYKPNRIFGFSNNEHLAIYGTEENEDGKNISSEFTLYQCSNNNKINEWDGTQYCTIKHNIDTLIIEELYAIPNGENFSIQWLEFFVTEFYYIDNIIARTSYYRTNLDKYTEKEINLVLAQFDSLKKPIQDFENYISLINRLFWAYVSGSKKAETRLEKLKNQYGKYDGGNSETFDSLIMTYENYKEYIK